MVTSLVRVTPEPGRGPVPAAVTISTSSPPAASTRPIAPLLRFGSVCNTASRCGSLALAVLLRIRPQRRSATVLVSTTRRM